MNLPQRICDSSNFDSNNLRISYPEQHQVQSKSSFHVHNQTKTVEPSRTARVLSRVSSCRDGARGCYQQRSNYPLPPQTFLSKDVQSMELQAPESKNYLNSGTGVHQINCENGPLGAKLVPQNAQSLLRNQDYRVESTQDFLQKLDADNGVKFSNSFGAVRQDKANYINADLVKKILSCQKNQARSKTPMMHLAEATNTEIPSAGQQGSRYEKPGHHISDTSISVKIADCGVNNVDAVSTESLKDSGYHSGDSTEDRASATSDNIDLNRPTPWFNATEIVQLGPAPSGSSVDQCDYYFDRADNSMDLYSEQERLGNLNQAMTFLNQAIEFFQLAANVPGAPTENILRMRMKYNKAVLYQRKLIKQIGAKKTARRLPCIPQEVNRISTEDSNTKSYQQLYDSDMKNVFPPYPQNKNPEFRNSAQHYKNTGFIDGDNRCQETVSNKLKNNTTNDVNLFGTLPENNRNDHLVLERVSRYPNESKTRPGFPLSSSHHNDAVVANRESNQMRGYVTRDPPSDCSNRPMPECFHSNGPQTGTARGRELQDFGELTVPALTKVSGCRSYHEVPSFNKSRSHDMTLQNHNVDQSHFLRSRSDAS